jgi:hypothetical protein
MHHRKRMSRGHYLLLCDVIADTENRAFSIVACWTVFTELLPDNALIKSVTVPAFTPVILSVVLVSLTAFCTALY